jgi:hypothetical protein
VLSEKSADNQQQAAEGGDKPGGEKQQDDAAKEPEAKADEPEGAPETYDLKAPEGLEVDDGLLADLGFWARKLDLTNEATQKLVDDGLKDYAELVQTRTAAMRAEWVAEAKADPDIGGKAFDANLEIAHKAINEVAKEVPGFRELLNVSGMGDHPVMIRAWHWVGRSISEDAYVSGGDAPKESDDLKDPEVLARRLYPDSQ